LIFGELKPFGSSGVVVAPVTVPEPVIATDKSSPKVAVTKPPPVS
jgi:hypothetical protein